MAGPCPTPTRVAARAARPAQTVAKGPEETCRPPSSRAGCHFSLRNQAKSIFKCLEAHSANMSNPAPLERPHLSPLGTLLETPA